MPAARDGSGEAGTAEPLPPRSLVVALALAWLVPGMGHVYLGWWRRGLLYLGILAFMYGFGLWMEGALSSPQGGLSTLACIADAGIGPAYFVLKMAGLGAGRAASATYEYGNAFHWSAGIMNMLLVLDVFDIRSGRK